MKTFEARATELPDGPAATLNFARMAELSINQVQTTGLTFSEMAERLEMVKKFKGAKDGAIIELEDSEAVILAECVKVMRWTVLSADILAFGKYVETL